jgi:hypothetical protein
VELVFESGSTASGIHSLPIGCAPEEELRWIWGLLKKTEKRK